MLATKILTCSLNSLGKKSIWKVKHHFKVPEGVQKLILTFPPSLSDHLLVTACYLDVHIGQWDVLINQSFPLFVEMVNSTINGGWELSVFLTLTSGVSVFLPFLLSFSRYFYMCSQLLSARFSSACDSIYWDHKFFSLYYIGYLMPQIFYVCTLGFSESCIIFMMEKKISFREKKLC